MNLGGNIAGISVPIIVGLIVQFTGSYYLSADVLLPPPYRSADLLHY